MARYKIKERRKEIGMSQAELVKRSGVSRATLSILENGYEHDIKVDTLISIAKELHCCVGMLVD